MRWGNGAPPPKKPLFKREVVKRHKLPKYAPGDGPLTKAQRAQGYNCGTRLCPGIGEPVSLYLHATNDDDRRDN